MRSVESRTTGRPMFWITPPTDRAGVQSYRMPMSQPVLEVPPGNSTVANPGSESPAPPGVSEPVGVPCLSGAEQISLVAERQPAGS